MDLPVTASSISGYLPQILEHLGEDSQLSIDLTFVNPEVKFGMGDDDV